MGKHWCLNGTMVDADKYSSPVPFIGLYTATATLVCLILILCDIWFGYRRRKSWFPCRFFSLNSITLTLLSISTKIPVDLTSAMPSSQDQLSKLTGTIFICMTMAFLMPSTGALGEIECYSNMVALSIFIITVIVNICVQMATGVIFSFIVEHAIILFCMLMFMVLLWTAAFTLSGLKELYTDFSKSILRWGPEESLLERVKVCYLQGYDNDPQFVLCHSPICVAVSLICLICVVILAEVLIRTFASKDLQFCTGVSAYGWSVWSVVGTQTVTIAVVSFCIGYRWLRFADGISSIKKVPKLPHDSPYLVVAYSYYVPQSLDSLTGIYRLLMIPCVDLMVDFLNFVSQKLGGWMRSIRCMSKHEDWSIEDFKHILQRHDVEILDWILKEAVVKMERLMQLSTTKRPQHLMNLLCTTNLSRDSLAVQHTSEASCLSILLLLEMAKVSIPNSLTTSMMADVIAEIFPIIYFIDRQKSNRGFNSKVKSMTAKILFEGKARSGVMRPKMGLRSMVGNVQSHSELARALGLIGVFHHLFVDRAIWSEGYKIRNVFLLRQHLYDSLNELCDDMKSLFVHILSELLSQLPMAIFNYVAESPAEEYEERVRLCLKYICQVKLLEPFVIWSFPTGCNITGLINSQAHATDTQSNNPAGSIAGLIDAESQTTDTYSNNPAGNITGLINAQAHDTGAQSDNRAGSYDVSSVASHEIQVLPI